MYDDCNVSDVGYVRGVTEGSPVIHFTKEISKKDSAMWCLSFHLKSVVVLVFA